MLTWHTRPVCAAAHLLGTTDAGNGRRNQPGPARAAIRC